MWPTSVAWLNAWSSVRVQSVLTATLYHRVSVLDRDATMKQNHTAQRQDSLLYSNCVLDHVRCAQSRGRDLGGWSGTCSSSSSLVMKNVKVNLLPSVLQSFVVSFGSLFNCPAHNFNVLVHSLSYQAAVFTKSSKTPLYPTCSAPSVTQTKLDTSWWT